MARTRVPSRITRKSVIQGGGLFRFGQWDIAKRAFKTGRIRAEVSRLAQVVGEKQAKALREQIAKTILDGQAGGPPLSPATVEMKGSQTPWFNTGVLAKSIDLVRLGKFTWGIGFKSGTGSHRDMDVAAIAIINEFGATIKVTERMRGFLAARGIFLQKATKVLIVPARPVVRPAISKMLPKFRRAFLDLAASEMLQRLTT